MNHWRSQNGLPFEFGATRNSENNGINFCLFSKNATEVTLLLFHTSNPTNIVTQYKLDNIENRTNSMWHFFLPDTELTNINAYAYSVNGINGNGNIFNPKKLLLDPYAKAIFFPTDFSRNAAVNDNSNIGKAPLAYLPLPNLASSLNQKANSSYHYHDLVIYEMHVKGFTQSANSNLTPDLRGTFRGIVEKIPYLKELGITAVELLPIHQFDPNEANYWGYMTLNFFSPHNMYCTDRTSWDAIGEFKEMVNELHKADIEVILDVVYNHTTELGKGGPTYSYRGIDNSSYYLLDKNMSEYINDAGTGNVLRTSYKMVRKLILDSLRYWVQEMNVDGFRFDLATIFTRNDDGTVNLNNPPILEEISLDPVLSNIRLIAEPWDIESYQLGQKFSGATWAQWNGLYRDDIRKFVKGDNDMISKVMARLYGSSDLFSDNLPHSGKPYQSINFITCHDGFSLYDLVSYNQKHNEANGLNNTDGSNDNFSWNCGQEGDYELNAETLRLRKQQVKNFVTILMFSNGTPMFRMGDEFLQTQLGNNNAYNQDNETSWLNWDLLSKNNDTFQFFKNIISLRKNHPSLSRGTFWRQDISWFGAQGQADLSYYSHTIAYLINGQSQNDDDFYIMMNMYWQDITFNLPLDLNAKWVKIIDTSLPSPNDIVLNATTEIKNQNMIITARSIVVLQKRK